MLTCRFAVAVFVPVIAIGCSFGSSTGVSSNLSNSTNSIERPAASPSNTNANNDPSQAYDEIGKVPDEKTLKTLANETTAQLATAMITDDFSRIYQKLVPDFQRHATEKQFRDSFMNDLDETVLTAQVLKQLAAGSLDPKFSPAPYVQFNVKVKTGQKGYEKLVVQGEYPTKPKRVNFDYEFVKLGGEWRVLKVLL